MEGRKRVLGPSVNVWLEKHLEMRQKLSMKTTCLPLYLLIILWYHFPGFETGVSTQQGEKKAITNYVLDNGEHICISLWYCFMVRENSSKYLILEPIKMSTLFSLQHPWERHRRTGPDTQPPDGTAPFFCI